MFYRNVYTPPTRKILIKERKIGSISSGFEAARKNRLKYIKNPLISYLNTNSLRNKVINLREIILDYHLIILFLAKQKLTKALLQGNFTLKGMK